jgi:PTH1 family peptidyl-tRNA hydrolase
MGRGIQLVVGLGNPGERYQRTWHNVGFLTVEAYVERLGGAWAAAEKGKGEAARVETPGGTVRVIKPHTFMNLSGDMVGPYARYFKIPPESVLVVSDDFNLPLGRIRIRTKGSAGGQNGLASVLENFGSQAVPRLRLGIGPAPARLSAADFVLKRYSGADKDKVDEAVEKASRAISDITEQGVEAAMSLYNGAEA